MRCSRRVFLLLVMHMCLTLQCSDANEAKDNEDSSDSSESSDSSSSSGSSEEPCSKKIVCYYASWASYRTGGYSYTIDTLDTKLCTHYIYSFAKLDAETFKIIPGDQDKDIKEGYFKKFCKKVKESGKTPMLALGGWNESTDKYETLINNSKYWEIFIESVIEFFLEYGFVGLDMDYEYPGAPQGDAKNPNTKKELTKFMKKLYAALNARGWLLSIAIGAGEERISYSYEVEKLQDHCHWLGIMGYDYHSSNEGKTFLHAPLIPQPGASKKLNVKYTVEYLLKEKVRSSKIILGLPAYGKGNTLENPSKHTINCPTTGASTKVEISDSAGTMFYFEICQREKKGWLVETEYEGKYYGRWMSKGDQWVGYDGPQEFKKKCDYVLEKDLQGVMVWTIDEDDSFNKCDRGAYPLISVLSEQLGGGSGESSSSSDSDSDSD